MRKSIDESIVTDTINELKILNEFTVKALANALGVSRGYLYKYFDQLLPKVGKKSTETEILRAISVLRDKTGKNKFGIGEVATQANISRQLLSRDYRHLYPYIEGKCDLPSTISNIKTSPQSEIRQLHAEIKKLIVQHKTELKTQENRIFTDLMLRDLKTFSAHETDLTLNKLQTQNDELKSQNRNQLNELASIKAKLIEAKHDLVGGVSTKVLAHFKANYKSIIGDLDEKEVFKLFLSAEKRNLDAAIEACITSKPDAVLFIQSFLTCDLDELALRVNAKRIVIIESNCFLPRSYNELVDNLSGIPIHAFSAQNLTLAKARHYCRKQYGGEKFSDEFLRALHDKIALPSLRDGFSSVTTFASENLFSVVRSS